DQMDVQDVDFYAPPGSGGSNAGDLRLRGLLFLASGEFAKARDYFTKSRDAGLGDAIKPYLDRMDLIDQGEKEVGARKAWMEVTSLYNAKRWKEAKLALESFKEGFGTTECARDSNKDMEAMLA